MMKLKQESKFYLIISSSALLLIVATQAFGCNADELQRSSEVFEPESMFKQMRSDFENALKSKENPLARFLGGHQFKLLNGRTGETGTELEKNINGTSQTISLEGIKPKINVSVKVERSAEIEDQSEREGSNIFTKRGSEKVIRILSNPTELLDLIAKHFNLDVEKLKAQVGKSVSLGTETLISPALVGVQIIEKVFVPDKCRLKLMCRVGNYITGMKNNSLFRLDSKHTESSQYMRAFHRGFDGNDCEGAFPNCEPKLQKPYEDFIASARKTFAFRGQKITE